MVSSIWYWSMTAGESKASFTNQIYSTKNSSQYKGDLLLGLVSVQNCCFWHNVLPPPSALSGLPLTPLTHHWARLTQKNPSTQEGGGEAGVVEDIEFLRVPIEERASGNSRGQLKKWNFHGSWFLTMKFQRAVTQFSRNLQKQVLQYCLQSL